MNVKRIGSPPNAKTPRARSKKWSPTGGILSEGPGQGRGASRRVEDVEILTAGECFFNTFFNGGLVIGSHARS